MDLYEVKWKQREEKGSPIEQCSRLVYASSKQRAEQSVMEIEGFCLLKRYPPCAVRLDSEDALRKACGEYWRPELTFVEDERDYLFVGGRWQEKADGDCFGVFLSDLLPDLRKRWRQLANEAEEKRLQMKLRMA